MVRGSRSIAQPADEIGDLGPLHVRDLDLPQRGQDVDLQRDAIALNGGRLVPGLGVLDHEAVAQILHRRRCAGDLPLLARVRPAPN